MLSPLSEPVEAFVEDLAPVLARVAADAHMAKGVKGHRAASDVALEAYNLAAAFIDADGLHTDDELAAFIVAFAPHFETDLHRASPAAVREARLVEGKAAWLADTSVLFQILLGDDHRQKTTNTWRYFRHAMAIAHAVASLDRHPAQAELEAIDRFRTMLLEAMDRWEVPRPGTQAGGAAAATAAGVPAGVPAPAPAEGPAQEPARPLEELLAELDALVGLAPVKAEVRLVADLIQVQNLRRARNLPVAESSRHLVFTGNPGTGKTTVARLLAQIYRTLGVVAKGHLVETDRSQLVAGYVGQTAIQVRKVVEGALGGVLLVDEAYALARGGERDFGQEAIDTLVAMVENHRDEVVVIAAGYPDEMRGFIESNPGLRSRFPKTIFFPDYSDDELVAIFSAMCAKASYRPTEEALADVRALLEATPRDKGFGNARLARNLFEASVAHHASRVVDIPDVTDDQLMTITGADVRAAAAAGSGG